MRFRLFFFLLRLLLLYLLYLLVLYQSNSLDYESYNDRSDSGSSSTYSFPDFSLGSDNSVGCVSGLGYGIFVPTGVESKFDIFVFVVFVLIGVKSKGG